MLDEVRGIMCNLESKCIANEQLEIIKTSGYSVRGLLIHDPLDRNASVTGSNFGDPPAFLLTLSAG